MPTPNAVLTHCPACNAELTAEPVTGDCRYYVCSTHRRFGISGTAIAMINANEHYKATVGKRIEDGRSNELDLVIMSDDINSPRL